MGRTFTDTCPECGDPFNASSIARVENIIENHIQSRHRSTPQGPSLEDALQAVRDELGDW